MRTASLDWFKNQIVDLEIAREIITTSVMCSETRNTFEEFLIASETNKEDWEILRERLAGWLYKNQSC